MTPQSMRVARRFATFCGIGVVSCAANATNGIYLTSYGLAASGMGGVSIGLPQDAVVAANNPAGMAEVGNRFDLYGVVMPTRSESTFVSESNQLTSQAVLPALGLGANYQITPQWTAGISVTGAGLASDYERPLLPVPGAGVAKSSLTQVNLSPTITFKPRSDLALGASLILGVQQFRANGVIAPGPGGMPVAVPSHGNAYATGVGGSFGVLWTPSPIVSVGATYFTKTRFSSFSGYKDDLFATSGGHVDGPSKYGVGVAFRPLDNLTLGIDYLRLEWSKAAGYNSPAFNWHDQNVVRLGVAYDINSRWTIRAGYSFANSHLDSDHTLANLFAPGISGRAVTAGVSYNIDKANSITAAIEYNIPRTIVGTGPSTGTNIHTNFQVYTIGYTHKF